MGCCHSTNNSESDSDPLQKLRQAIRASSSDLLESAINQIRSKMQTPVNLNTSLIQIKNAKLTPLSYALWEGNLSAFKILYETFSLSLVDMEKNLADHNFNSLSLLCERNYTDFLQYYIPVYVKLSDSLPNEIQSSSFDIENSFFYKNKRNWKSPVHIACEAGHISTLLTIFNYSKDAVSVPPYLNLHYQDAETGENCVLIACRKGNYPMLKFLKDVVNADFGVRNNKGEDAISILLIGYTKHPNGTYYNCLVFLEEKGGLRISKNYDEKLILAQDKRTIEFISSKLHNKIFEATKGCLEMSSGKFSDFSSSDKDFKEISSVNISNNFHGNDKSRLSSIGHMNITNESSGFGNELI